MDSEFDLPQEIPIDGILDLHTFAPRDVKELVPVYLEECLAADVLDVRIIHGKGQGVLREIVQGILKKHPAVVSFGHPNDGSAWGATVVRLAHPED